MTCPEIGLDDTREGIDISKTDNGEYCFFGGLVIPDDILCSCEIETMQYPRGKERLVGMYGPAWFFEQRIRPYMKEHGYVFKENAEGGFTYDLVEDQP